MMLANRPIISLLIIVVHLSLGAKAFFWTSDEQQQQQQASSTSLSPIEQASSDYHEFAMSHQQNLPMSCFACSTMDYNNPSDNICRELKRRDDRSGGQISRLAREHANTKSPVMLGETSKSRPLKLEFEATIHGNGDYQEPSVSEDYSAVLVDTRNKSSKRHITTTMSTSIINDKEDELLTTFTSSKTPPTTPTLHSTATNSLQHQQQQQQQLHNTPQNYRSTTPNNSIRLRPCLEDEHFCSIVSVVRLEFVQDHYYTKFWALERNCSKSCNTGCMLIGERVRLRVCSQCCRTANCNVGGGASPSGQLASQHFTLTFMLAIAISWLLISFGGSKSNL